MSKRRGGRSFSRRNPGSFCMADPVNQRSHPTRSFWLAGLLVLGLGVAGLIFLAPKFRKSAPPPREVSLQALVNKAGRVYLQGTTDPFTGVIVEHWANGGSKSRSTVSNGWLEGASEGWHTNGQRQVQERFHIGVSQGLRTKWFANGQKESEGMIVEGKHHGLFRRWNPDGSLAEEIEMNHGNPNGLSRAFYPSGFVKAEARLREGQVVERKFWKDGEQKTQTPVRN